MFNITLPVQTVGPLLLFAAGFVAYWALFAAVLHHLAFPRRTIAKGMGVFLLGLSLGLLSGGVLTLLSQ